MCSLFVFSLRSDRQYYQHHPHDHHRDQHQSHLHAVDTGKSPSLAPLKVLLTGPTTVGYLTMGFECFGYYDGDEENLDERFDEDVGGTPC